MERTYRHVSRTWVGGGGREGGWALLGVLCCGWVVDKEDMVRVAMR